MKKIVLLYNPKSVFYDMPLALLAIGSVLDKNEYEVIIIDGRIDENPLQIISKYTDRAICLGITSLTGNPIKDALFITSEVKKLNKDLPIIWGGWHTSLFPEQTLHDERNIDITVQGQGEETFKELVEAIANQQSVASINGICYRNSNGEVVKNPLRTISPMDNFVDVNYDLIDVERYFEKKGKRQLDYISSTGCHFRCTFCADPFVYERKWTAISADKMVDKIAELHQKYKFVDLNLQDETYFTFRNRVVEIANGFIEKKLNITWAATMRADQGARLTDEDFEICAKSGLRRLLIGVESGSQEMMDWLKKDIKMEQVYLCAERCKKHNIAVIFPFIVGFPEESEVSVNNTIKMVKELNAMHNNFSTPIFYFKPYPGTSITDEVIKKGYELPNTIYEWSEFDYIGSTGPWVSEEKYDFFEKFKFYLKLGYTNQKMIFKPIQIIAKWRCENNIFKLPFEMKIYELLFKKQQLS